MMRFGSFLLPLLWVAWGCGTRKPLPDASSKAIDTASVREMYYAAEFHYIQGNWKQSDSLFRRYIRSNMPPGPAYHRLACIASKNGKNDEALVLNEKARKADTSVEDWLWLDAELYRRKNEYKKAADIYSAFTIRHPRAWTAYAEAARLYASGGEDPSIIALCDRWEKAFGLMEPIVEYRARALSIMGEPKKAAEQWAALRRKYPDRHYYRYNQVNTLKNNGAEDEAKRLLDTFIAQDPQDVELQALYCEIITATADSVISPYIEKIAHTRGMSFKSKWKCLQSFTRTSSPAYDSSERLLRGLCSLHPTEPEVLKALGLWCLYHGKAADAAKYLRQTLDAQEQSLVLWQQYLTALSMGCETQKMLFEADTLLELYAMVPESYQMKAIALFLNGMSDEALRVCSDGERISDHNTGLKALKSYLQIQAGKKQEDIKIDYVSDLTRSDAVMVRVEWALSQKQWEEAETLLNSIFGNPETLKAMRFGTLDIMDPEDNHGNAWPFFQCVLQKARLALLTQKNQAAAIDLLKQYLPESPMALELMGDLYGTQSVSALACYENALRCADDKQKDRLSRKINPIKNR